MSEALAGCAVWPDVRKETFEMLVQFAYTGDYSIPRTEGIIERPAKPMKESAITDVEERWGMLAEPDFPEILFETPFDAGGTWSFSTTKKKEEKRTTKEFPSLKYDYLFPRNKYTNCEPIAKFNPDQGYLNVLLGHTTLYILADFWLVNKLKDLTLYKLHKTLCAMMGIEDLGDVLELVKFVYAEDTPVHGVRELVCQFLVDNTKALADDERFFVMLRQGGQFVEDFFQHELLRIH